jgi:hypothetical protein
VSTVKIRVWGKKDDCRATVEQLSAVMAILSVSGWVRDQPRRRRGAVPDDDPSESILGRVYVEADLPAGE